MLSKIDKYKLILEKLCVYNNFTLNSITIYKMFNIFYKNYFKNENADLCKFTRNIARDYTEYCHYISMANGDINSEWNINANSYIHNINELNIYKSISEVYYNTLEKNSRINKPMIIGGLESIITNINNELSINKDSMKYISKNLRKLLKIK